jgi:SP family sugar:H+ symporter-like MFS transporter
MTISAFQTWTSLGNPKFLSISSLLTLVTGSLIGSIIDNFTHSLPGRRSYVLPLGIIYIMPGLIALGLLFIPESPRWLLQLDKEDSARKSLLWLRPFPELVDAELLEMKTAIDAEKMLAQHSAITDLFRDPIDRRRTLLAIGAVSLQAASGAMYMICELQKDNYK